MSQLRLQRNTIYKMHDVQYTALVSCLLSVVFGITFGQHALMGELIKPIYMFFSYLHAAFPLIHPPVEETQVVELVMTTVVLNLAAGALLLFINMMLKRSFRVSKTRTWKANPIIAEAVVRLLVTAGFAMFTVSSLVIGWDRPSFRTFSLMLMIMFAPGCGLVTWGSLVLVTGRGAQNRMMMAVYIAAPVVFTLFFFPVMNSYVTTAATRNEFHLVFRSVGTLSTPLLLMMAFFSFLDVCNMEKKGSEPEDMKQPPMDKYTVVSVTLCIAGKAIFAPVFFGMQILFTNYLNILEEPGFEFGLPAEMTLTCVLLAAGGGLVGRIMLALVTERGKLSDLIHLAASLGSVGVTVGWRLGMVNGFGPPSGSGFPGLASIAFFAGLCNSVVFYDGVLRASQSDLALTSLVVLSGGVVSTMRYSTGFLSNNYFTFSLILAILAGVSAGLEMTSMLVRMVGGSKAVKEIKE